MKIVLDTNCLLQIIPRSARHRWLFDLIKRGDIHLAVTSEILFEYEEQLADFYSPVVADGVLQMLDTLENILPVQVFFHWNLIRLTQMTTNSPITLSPPERIIWSLMTGIFGFLPTSSFPKLLA